MKEHCENYIKELGNIRKNKSKLKHTIIEMKTTLEGINTRLDGTEEQIGDLEDRIVEITPLKTGEKKRIFKIENSLRDLWDNM